MQNTASILGVGAALPHHRIDQTEASHYGRSLACVGAEQARKVDILYRRSGIEKRGSVLLEKRADNSLGQSFYPAAASPADRGPSTAARNDRYAEEAPKLADVASRIAVTHSGVAADRITHLVTVSCTGFSAPGIDIALIDRLQLPLTTQRVHVGFMGCHGAINGLRAAQGLIAANRRAVVLMCCVELCSLHFQYGYDVDRIVSGAIFADGAAAMVLGGADDHSEFGSVIATGSFLVPDSRGAMSWRIGNYGYEMTLSATVPNLIEQQLRPFLSDWLKQHDESIESIGGWAVHPGGVRVLAAVEKALGFSGDQLELSRRVLADHGNMSSATMPVILNQFARARQPKPWLMLGFGPGLEIEVALVR